VVSTTFIILTLVVLVVAVSSQATLITTRRSLEHASITRENPSYHRRKQWDPTRGREGFVNEGAFVFTTGRRQAELGKAAKEIGTNVITVRSDVSKLEDLDRLYKEVAEKKGKIDILFAKRGHSRGRGNAGSNS
jgi:hypothetical protein